MFGKNTQGMDIRPVEICALVWWVKVWDFWFHPPCLRETEKVSGWFLHAWFPQSNMEEEVWWCGGALLMTLLVIYLKFKAHLTSMVTAAFCSGMPSYLDHHFSFNRTMTSNTLPDFVMAIWPRGRVIECCIRWPGLHSQPAKPYWDGWEWDGPQSEGKAGDYLMKLIERMPRVSKAVIEAKASFFEEFKIWNSGLLKPFF